MTAREHETPKKHGRAYFVCNLIRRFKRQHNILSHLVCGASVSQELSEAQLGSGRAKVPPTCLQNRHLIYMAAFLREWWESSGTICMMAPTLYWRKKRHTTNVHSKGHFAKTLCSVDVCLDGTAHTFPLCLLHGALKGQFLRRFLLVWQTEWSQWSTPECYYRNLFAFYFLFWLKYHHFNIKVLSSQ